MFGKLIIELVKAAFGVSDDAKTPNDSKTEILFFVANLVSLAAVANLVSEFSAMKNYFLVYVCIILSIIVAFAIFKLLEVNNLISKLKFPYRHSIIVAIFLVTISLSFIVNNYYGLMTR